MSSATAAARALVETLVGRGVTEVVLCPGSRSAPLAYALHAADAAGVLHLHVRHDERAAAFTALGMGLAAGRPAAVVTTSGTAVANLHPAVLEAHESAVPMLVLTADRPHRLRGTWANQTTGLQAGLLRHACRYAADLPAVRPAGLDAWRDAVTSAVAAATGAAGGRPGPAHVDAAFDDPLVPEDLRWRPRVTPATASPPARATCPVEPAERTVVVAGAGAGDAARALAEEAGWPLLAEPSSGARGGPNAVGPYRLLLDADHLGAAVRRAVVLGRPTLSRPVTRLLARPEVEVVQIVAHPDDPGPARRVQRLVGSPLPPEPREDGWLAVWQAAGAAAAAAVDGVLDGEGRAGRLNGPLVAREVAAATATGELLVAAASNPVRDLDLAGRPWDRPRRVLANRGLSGIDGALSTAAGAALATRARTRVLVGDLGFLHDLNGLLLPPGEPEPDLQVVLLNDDGGGIFGLLEHGETQYVPAFERLFGTPHHADVSSLCAGLGVPHQVVGGVDALRKALDTPPPGRSVVEVRASRTGLQDLHARIGAAVTLAAGSATSYA